MKKSLRTNTPYYVVPKPNIKNNTVLFAGEEEEASGETNYEEFAKISMFGEKPSGLNSPGVQNYQKLREYHLRHKTLFVDDTFVPEAITMPSIKNKSAIVWKRPKEITADAKFIVDGTTRFDVNQGKLGDCWFLAAVSSLTNNQKLFSIVVPEDQSLDENYVGIFHFRFWQYGRWVDVVIDDRLPTIDNKLVFIRSRDSNEFWPALLEKAYAKFYGSYKNLEGGQITEALEDMCGGLSESYTANRPELYEIMTMSFQRSSFLGCFIADTRIEGQRPDGLFTSHAYSITEIVEVPFNDSSLRLVRLRNPWGHSEWNGDWSDSSQSWNQLPKDLKEDLLTRRQDGEFWMEFSDFQRCFSYVDIVHLNPSSFVFSENKNWIVHMYEGSWVPNVTAGGGLKFPKTFPHNPQYHVTINRSNADTLSQVVIGLMQKHRRGNEELSLELNIYRVESDAGELLDGSFFASTEPVVSRLESGIRQLTVRVELPVGRYCIVPSTWQPNIYGCFLLRVYSEVNPNIVENDNEVGYSPDAIILNQQHNLTHDNISRLFTRLAQNGGNLGWYHVKKALNKQFGTKRVFCFVKPKIAFSKDTCKNIVALWDANYSGRIEQVEFARLMNDIAALKATFQKFDRDHSGKLSGFELRNLLAACGYKVNQQILTIIMLRYGFNGSISFESFVVCAFKLKTMIDEFHRRSTIEARDQINVNRRDWLQTTLYS